MKLLPCGDRALLVELPDDDTRRAWSGAIRRARVEGRFSDRVIEDVPAARTVLVRVRAAEDISPVARMLRELDPTTGGGEGVADPALVIPVTYDGEDLPAVADHLGMSVDGVIAWHTGQLWRVDFAGFSPGFGYLLRDNPARDAAGGALDMPRRASPRTRVPAGSVALAGPWTGIYPSATSGGWQLLGRTALPMWDPDREPPALLTPGRPITFEAVR